MEIEELRQRRLQGERRERGVRLFSLLVVAAVTISLTALVFYLDQRLNTVAGEYADLRQDFEQQQAALEVLESTLSESVPYSSSLARLEDRLLSRLDETERRQYALELAKAPVGRQELSPAEQRLVEAEADSEAGEDTADSYYLAGISATQNASPADSTQTAIELYTKALEVDPNHADAHFALGAAYAADERYQDAIASYSEGLVIRDDAYGYAGRAFAQLRIGNAMSAVEDSTRSIELNADNWVPYNYRAFGQLLLGDVAEAERDWEAAAEHRPDPLGKAWVRENLGLIYLRSERWKDALSLTNELTAIDPSSPWVALFAWIANDKIGERDAAESARSRWTELSGPSDIEALRVYLPEDLHSYLDTP
jgi:tetratricopeptide (TPR) repeat protein